MASRPTVTTQRVVQTHWWSKMYTVSIDLRSELSQSLRDITVPIDLDKLQNYS